MLSLYYYDITHLEFILVSINYLYSFFSNMIEISNPTNLKETKLKKPNHNIKEQRR